jgi:FkbM family methyltransferase
MIESLLKRSVSLVPWRLRGVIKKLPFLAPLQRKLLERWVEGREFVYTVDAGPARGLKYPIKLPDDKGIWTGTYELALATRIVQTIKPGDTCLDIGGWRGFFSAVMSLAGATRVIVFEPLPENASQIRRLLELNPAFPIEVIEAAVGQGESVMEFVVMAESSMGKLAGSSFQMGRPGAQRISVRVVGVDELIAAGQFAPPNVVKIDVEGAEMLVLRGAKGLLADYRPTLFIEVHSPELAIECSVFLRQFEYNISVLEQREQDGVHPNADICHFIAEPRR